MPLVRADPVDADDDRLEALEQQVRQLTSRLAGWVEAQLVQAMEDRRTDLKALRSELESVVNEQLAGLRAETASVLGVATRRLDLSQEQLGQRLEALEDGLPGDGAPPAAPAAQVGDGIERRVRQAMSRLTDSVEAQLAQVTEGRKADGDAVRRELEATLDERLLEAGATASAGVQKVQERLSRETEVLTERLDELARHAAAFGGGRAAAASEMAAANTRNEAFEQRIKSALGRLTDTVDSRMTQAAAAGQAELDQIRSELGARVDGLGSAAQAGAERIEALEVHTRRTDGKLTELVEEKFAVFRSDRGVELEKFRTDLQRAVSGQVERIRADVAAALGVAGADLARQRIELQARLATDSAEARAEMVAMLDGARAELAAGMAELDARRLLLAGEGAALEARLQVNAELTSTVTALGERAGDARAALGALAERVDQLAEQIGRAGSLESSTLAPLRSDMQTIQSRLDEVADNLAALGSARKSPSAEPAAARKVTAAEKARAVAARPPRPKRQ